MAKLTPMMEQYLQIKEEAKDAILFFRLGDFYEIFFDDALTASRELEITLTGRNAGLDEKAPMCGVPYHSAEGYVQRLIEKGYKVAICEQVEEPGAGRGMMKREIVRVVTPGTLMESRALGEKSNNYLVCVTRSNGMTAIAACDLSTGDLHVTSAPDSEEWLKGEVGVYQPSEAIGDETLLKLLEAQIAPMERRLVCTPWDKSKEDGAREQFGEAAWARLDDERRQCVARLFAYLAETQKRALGQLTKMSVYEPNHYMILDPFTRRNLELTETVRERSKKGSLLWLLDRTKTSMGARTLRRWIDKPLLQRGAIEERLEAVEHLHRDLILRGDIQEALREIYDLERLVGRVAFGSANGRDMVALRDSLVQIPGLKQICLNSGSRTLAETADRMDECAELAEAIAAAVTEEPPVSVRDGGLIRKGYHEHLDQLREASVNGKRWIAELEAEERRVTGIRSLKVGYNKVFGYYIEVTRANLGQLPEGRYERKQTLANAERYITPELKEKESLILEAEEKMADLEYGLFLELREKVAERIPRLKSLAERVAEIDVYQAFAEASAEKSFVRPQLHDGYDLAVDNGRHPVVEAVMEGGSFVANATDLTEDGANIMLITGPNMAGKSTYMRQVALISIMAQIGCFVPANRASVPLLDRIFTRIGAADDLVGGQSTFMVEMADIQVMTQQATRDSLIIIDELGRGTSTSEGMAIAQAVIEHVHESIGCKALVSTHFHELAHLEESLPRLRNYCMAVRESGDNVTFLRKLVPGAASTSYGIYCARLAGLPGSIIDRAYGLLQGFEQAAAEVAVGHSGTASGERFSKIEIRSNEAMSTSSARTAVADKAEIETSGAQPAKPASNTNGNEVRERLAVAEETAEAGRETVYGARSGQEEALAEQSSADEVVQLSIFGDEERPARAAAHAAPAQVKEDPKVKKMLQKVRELDVMNMTPLQAMQLLNELKLEAQRL
ncbi:DNA mismatch repair protein MutS [Saccharibacillus sp. O23]|uniref:DNA mismatch repair protein MutS n=1 Tax=Saccharibacillus sp. O23 TaxID=2009338 RepID=UPI000B4DFDCA|nr:DNA mismatch repair protein MutS [Saccharibacillus sp. O23]OWR31373.1 DNA mismatch repair protein MutS [Saccharibacillus sp. O23]